MSELTVGDLVAMSQLGAQVIAGDHGLGRRVVWAHSCELDDPWNWLSADELLMTTGICIPDDAERQVTMIRELDRAGLAGVAVGDDLKAPPLSPEMLAEADALDFPMLLVTHSTPFAAIGRTVAVAGHSEQVGRIARLSRLYEVARSDSSDSTLLDRLSAELGFELHVVDVEFGTEVLAREHRLDGRAIRALCHRVADTLDYLPARISIEIDGAVTTAFPLSTHRVAMLAIVATADIDLDAFRLLHAQSLIGIEVERATRTRERNEADGADLLTQIADGSLGSDAALPRLEHAGLTTAERVVLCFDAAHLRAARTVVGDSLIPTIGCVIGEEAYLLAADDLDTLTDLLTAHAPQVGASAPTKTVQRLPDSIRQARWALQAARANGTATAEYSTAAPLFLPRTLSEAQFAARAVLGDLIDYDEANQSQLVDTLEQFLTLDRSWAATAEKLLIHRQTLAYRLKKIESITGRSTKSSADIASLWMALVARRISLGGPGM